MWFQYPRRPADTTVFADALQALPTPAVQSITGPTMPDMWRATVAVLDKHPLPGLLALLLTSYKLYAQRPDADSQAKLDALTTQHPELAAAMKKPGSRTKIPKLTFNVLPRPPRNQLTFAQGGAEAKSSVLGATLEQGLAAYERARRG